MVQDLHHFHARHTTESNYIWGDVYDNADNGCGHWADASMVIWFQDCKKPLGNVSGGYVENHGHSNLQSTGSLHRIHGNS